MKTLFFLLLFPLVLLAQPQQMLLNRPAASSGVASCSTVGDGLNLTLNDSRPYAGTVYLLSQFTATASYTACSAAFSFYTNGSPSGTITYYVYADNAGVPGAQLTGGASSGFALVGNVSATSGAAAHWITNSGFSCSITNGSVYWIGASVVGTPSGAFVQDFIGTGKVYWSANGSTWSSYSTTRELSFYLLHN